MADSEIRVSGYSEDLWTSRSRRRSRPAGSRSDHYLAIPSLLSPFNHYLPINTYIVPPAPAQSRPPTLMTQPLSAPPPPAAAPGGTIDSSLSLSKSFRPYYSPLEIHELIRLHSVARSDGGPGKVFSEGRVEGWRQLACGFIERVGARLGFPRRTIATAQTLYHRFHLHYPHKDYPYHDVSVAAILVASKLEDTLKKLREIQIAAWQISNILDGGPGTGEGDLNMQEAHKPILIAIEGKILQTICFNFNLHRSPLVLPSSSSSPDLSVALSPRDVFAWTLRIAQALGATKSYTYLAHLLAIDSHRTLAHLSYPPHTIACACLYLAGFISVEVGPKFRDGWSERFESEMEDIEEIAHSILDLFIRLCPVSTNPVGAKPSPLSPLSLTSPSELALPGTRTSTISEKEKHLMNAGLPVTLSGIVKLGIGSTEEEFTVAKIGLRRKGRGEGKREREEGGGEESAKRWRRDGADEEEVGERKEKPVSVRYRF
ncbi:C-type cyclin [Pseudohyphozyma bogoriensis]|nr:C-type cyclin [Pseudohyphozyma bogoriensis]